jgi:alpha-mannosidase
MIAHYISGTHWDREWYRPFEEYRLLLVQLVDELLEIMEEDGEFRYFQFDGQTCMLEDYLDIRPENRERLGALIRDGRILIGPWFTMPDLFCPDGESLVRNLQFGRRIAREWGTDPMPVGFICDMFGHPSQMPQIFAGFGIRDIVMGRGTNESTTDMYFEWLAPDGTRALTFKLQDKIGYGAFAHPRAILEGESQAALQDLDGYAQFAGELADAAHDPDHVKKVREDWGRQSLGTYVNGETQRANLPVIAVMDTMDHIMPAEDVGRYLRLIHESAPGVAAHHSTLPQFFADIRSQSEDTELQKRRGEQREPSRDKCGYLYLIPNCVSARVRLKLAGDAAAGLLQRWSEPLLALAESKSEDIGKMRPFLDRAWKLVLTNHAHDSVCGCSIDQVHRDMMNRFEQAQVLGEQLRHQAFAALTVDCRELAQEKDDFTLTLFNPAFTPVEESVIFDIDLPTDYPASFHEGFRSQEVKSFVLEDAEGNTVPYQRLRVTPVMNERSRVAKHCFISDGPFARYTVAANLSLPACGYTSLRVRPAERPVRVMGSLRTGPVAAENEHLAISVANNGSLTLTDKRTGEIYSDLLTFEDRSEIGDGWFHGESVNDAPALSSATGAQVRVLHDGPEIVTFRIEVTLAVPKRYNWHAEAPVEETVPLRIRSDVSLRRGARVVDVATTIDNVAEDHRLQLLLPSDAADAQTYVAHTAFDLVTRPIALDTATSDWQEAEIVEKPFESMQAVGQGSRGLAFLSGGGLHEGGVRDDRRRTMQVTLLRSFRRTVGTEGEKDGLEPGTITCRYAIMPYAGNLPAATALRETMRLQTGLLARQTGKRPSGYPPLTGSDRHTLSFIEQEGDLILSSLKPAENESGTLILRLWNPADTDGTSTLRFHRPVRDAAILRLDEEPCADAADLKIDSQSVTLLAAAHRIVTLSVKLADSGGEMASARSGQ